MKTSAGEELLERVVPSMCLFGTARSSRHAQGLGDLPHRNVDGLVAFMEQKESLRKTGVSQDEWMMMLQFCREIQPSCDNYQARAAWRATVVICHAPRAAHRARARARGARCGALVAAPMWRIARRWQRSVQPASQGWCRAGRWRMAGAARRLRRVAAREERVKQRARGLIQLHRFWAAWLRILGASGTIHEQYL